MKWNWKDVSESLALVPKDLVDAAIKEYNYNITPGGF